MDPEKLMARFWGDNFFNPQTKKWRKSAEEGYNRGFNQFVMDPIQKVFDAILKNEKDKVRYLGGLKSKYTNLLVCLDYSLLDFFGFVIETDRKVVGCYWSQARWRGEGPRRQALAQNCYA